MCWSSTKRTSSPSHWKLTCSRHDIAGWKIAEFGVKQQSLTSHTNEISSYNAFIYNFLIRRIWSWRRKRLLKTFYDRKAWISMAIFESHSWRGLQYITFCDKVCQWLVTGLWFSPGTLVSSTTKTDCNDITEILLKVSLSTIPLAQWQCRTLSCLMLTL